MKFTQETIDHAIAHFDDKCSICLEEMLEDFCALPCKHLHHNKCLAGWIRAKGYEVICPLCRGRHFHWVWTKASAGVSVIIREVLLQDAEEKEEEEDVPDLIEIYWESDTDDSGYDADSGDDDSDVDSDLEDSGAEPMPLSDSDDSVEEEVSMYPIIDALSRIVSE